MKNELIIDYISNLFGTTVISLDSGEEIEYKFFLTKECTGYRNIDGFSFYSSCLEDYNYILISLYKSDRILIGYVSTPNERYIRCYDVPEKNIDI